MNDAFERLDLVQAADGELLVVDGHVVNPDFPWWYALSVQRPAMGFLQVSPKECRRIVNLKDLPRACRALRAYDALHRGGKGTQGSALSALVEELESVFHPCEDEDL